MGLCRRVPRGFVGVRRKEEQVGVGRPAHPPRPTQKDLASKGLIAQLAGVGRGHMDVTEKAKRWAGNLKRTGESNLAVSWL